SLKDQTYFRETVGKIISTRERFLTVIREWGWFVYPSKTNVALFEPRDARGHTGPDVAKALLEFLLSKKILVRYFPNHPFTAPFIRISIGTDSEMDRVEVVLREWLQD